MKILTWNMDHWKRTVEQRERAWAYLWDSLDPDIALLQEVAPSDSEFDHRSVHYHELDGRRNWGTATVSKLPVRREIHATHGYPGAKGVVVSEIRANESLLLTMVNVYGQIEAGYATTTMHHILSDLTPLLNPRGARNVVLGGDLNVSEQYDTRYKGQYPSHKLVFDRLEDFGLVNCTKRHYQGFVQTHVHGEHGFEWQNDYLFVSQSLAGRVSGCKVVSGPEILKLSDHYPVTITLDV